MVRRDHPLGFVMVWGVAQHLNGKKLGIIHFDQDCLDAAVVLGIGWPEQGGFMPREVLKFLQIIADAKPLAGMEIVECSPPYDAAEITGLMATRVICDVLACQVCSGHLSGRRIR